MKLGAERNKLLVLAGLLLVAVYFLFFNKSDDGHPISTPAPRSAAAQRDAQPVARQTSGPPPPNIRRMGARGTSRLGAGGEFKPSLKPQRPEDRPDPTTVDPTLRLDVLAKVQQVSVEAGQRSLFDFSAPPPPKPVQPAEAKIHAKTSPLGTSAAAKTSNSAPGTALKSAPPPIPLKFYGYLNPVRKGIKRAFFISGDDIFVASEGDMIQKRYKVVRINVNSVVMEDTQSRNEQTIRLEEQPG
ncbi:MAG: hypothetical protein IT160_19305 [Bryobacterales bacterium]|nr:hypothetical protein [Bryobacterales bacterium]